MQKILLIEDEFWRYAKVASFDAKVYWARNAQEVAAHLTESGPFDIVMWDYDLAAGIVNRRWENTERIAEDLVESLENEPLMLIHTWNTMGGAAKLNDILSKRFQTIVAPFGPAFYDVLRRVVGGVPWPEEACSDNG